MYDVSNGYRFRLVCLLLGLFLAGPALAATLYSPYAFPAEFYVDPAEAAQRDLCNYWGSASCPKYRLGANPSDINNTGASITYKVYRVSDGLLMGYSAKVYIRTGKECPAGYEEKDGKCVVPQNQCEEKAGQATPDTTLSISVTESLFNQVFGGGSKKPFASCHNGCKVVGNVSFGTGDPTMGYDIVTDKNKYTGDSCTPSDKADVPPPDAPPSPNIETDGGSAEPKVCPDTQCPGTVNGVSVCMKCDKLWTKDDSQSSTSSSSTSASGATSSDGSNTSSTSTTTCDETTGKCTTTTTTTKTNADGSSSSSTSTDTKSKGEYCAKNPWDTKQCGGKGNGSGSGGGTGDGEGDGEGEGEKCEDADLLKCMRAGDASGDSSVVGTAGATVNYTPSQSISLPTGCPAPKSFQYFGKTFHFDYDQLCIGAEKARPFVLLLAAAFASIIVVLGLRK